MRSEEAIKCARRVLEQRGAQARESSAAPLPAGALKRMPKNREMKNGHGRPEETWIYWQRYGDYVLMPCPMPTEVLVEGHGAPFGDATGRSCWTWLRGCFCCVLGHNHPKFIQPHFRTSRRVAPHGHAIPPPRYSRPATSWPQVNSGTSARIHLSFYRHRGQRVRLPSCQGLHGKNRHCGPVAGYYGTSLATKSCSSLFFMA